MGTVVARSSALLAALVIGLGSMGAACAEDDAASDATGEPTTPAVDTTSSDPVSSIESAPTDVAPTTIVARASDTAATTTEAPATTEEARESRLVNVYWGWNVGNPENDSPERIGAGAREVAADAAERNALDAMFDGVNDIEREMGMTSSIPEGTRVLGISVDGSTATVDLSSEFSAPGGTLDETMRLAQVVFAITQFDGVDRVKFRIDGEPQDPILSHGVEVGDGLTRDDVEPVRPAILIEEPHPGATVSDPLVIRGESNTFEATARYAVTDGEGKIVAEDFTTATAGSGIWGRFEVTLDLADLDGYRPGTGSVVMWEESPRDGSRIGLVEVPVILPEP